MIDNKSSGKVKDFFSTKTVEKSVNPSPTNYLSGLERRTFLRPSKN